jgi:hypothetical protein
MQEMLGFVMIVLLLSFVINNSLKGLTKFLGFIALGLLAARLGMPLISNRLPEVGNYFERGIDYFQTQVLPIFQGDEFAANNPEFGGTSQDQFQRKPYDGTQRKPYLNGSNDTAGSSQDRPFDESPDAARTPIDENAPPVPEGRTSIPYDDDLQNGGTPDSSSQQPVTAWW